MFEDQSEGEYEEESSEDEIDVDGLPKWKKGKRLARFPKNCRPLLYRKKIAASKQATHKLCMCERKVIRADFK
jgi:hypothetical protein